MRWNDTQLLGFSVRNITELERVIRLGVNLVEVKLERMAKSGFALYEYNGSNFKLNDANLHELRKLRKFATVHFHLPIENCIDPEKETGLNIGILEHHDIVMERFMMFEKIYHDFGLGSSLTIHPPVISKDGKLLLEEEKLIRSAKRFFDRLDAIRVKEKHQTTIGLENMTDIKTKAGNLGYLPRHFKRMLKDTRTIGLTLDTGHRRLTEDFRVRDFISLGFIIEKIHFHGNSGKFDPDNWDDDQHLLPNRANVHSNKNAYDNYLRYFRRHRVPVILEISHLEQYEDLELKKYLGWFMSELD